MGKGAVPAPRLFTLEDPPPRGTRRKRTRTTAPGDLWRIVYQPRAWECPRMWRPGYPIPSPWVIGSRT